jgi:hypothetical protein
MRASRTKEQCCGTVTIFYCVCENFVIPFYYGSRTVTIITVPVPVPLRFVIKLRFRFRYGKKLRFLWFRFLNTAADVEQRLGCGSTLVRENSGSRSRCKKSRKKRNFFLFVFFLTLLIVFPICTLYRELIRLPT